jgi:hypothetical protein
LADLYGTCRGFSRDSYQVLPSREAMLTAFKKNPEKLFASGPELPYWHGGARSDFR